MRITYISVLLTCASCVYYLVVAAWYAETCRLLFFCLYVCRGLQFLTTDIRDVNQTLAYETKTFSFWTFSSETRPRPRPSCNSTRPRRRIFATRRDRDRDIARLRLRRFSRPSLNARRIEYIMAGGMTGQSNSGKGHGHNRLPNITSGKWPIVRRRHYIFYTPRAQSGYLQSNQSQWSNSNVVSVVSAEQSQIMKRGYLTLKSVTAILYK